MLYQLAAECHSQAGHMLAHHSDERDCLLFLRARRHHEGHLLFKLLSGLRLHRVVDLCIQVHSRSSYALPSYVHIGNGIVVVTVEQNHRAD
jgi:hypothetical protein